MANRSKVCITQAVVSALSTLRGGQALIELRMPSLLPWKRRAMDMDTLAIRCTNGSQIIHET
uniref:Uncharacterized protein n=1 Tax=Oryza glumipatula TaxID=40148 RepID=A0A0D9YBL7_9ORYZ